MPNDNVQTLTGHPVLDAPIRNGEAQQSQASDACFQDVQSTWKKHEDIAAGQQNGDNVTRQGMSGKPGDSKGGGLPNLQIDGLDSNMGPFDPNAPIYQKEKDGSGRGSGKAGKGGCPEFEPRTNSTYPDGTPAQGGPDVRNNPYQGGGQSDLHAVPGYEKPELTNKPGFEKPHFFKKQPEKQGQDGTQTPDTKHKLDGGKCGGVDGSRAETPATQRQLTEAERIMEQKIIDQKIREMKLRERYKL